MIRLKRGDTLSENFMKALGKVLRSPAFDPKTAYRLSKIKQAFEVEREQTLQMYAKLGPEYAVKDEQGNPKRNEDGTWQVRPEVQTVFEKTWQLSLDEILVIPQHPIDAAAIAKLQFSAFEMELLAPLIAGLED